MTFLTYFIIVASSIYSVRHFTCCVHFIGDNVYRMYFNVKWISFRLSLRPDFWPIFSRSNCHDAISSIDKRRQEKLGKSGIANPQMRVQIVFNINFKFDYGLRSDVQTSIIHPPQRRHCWVDTININAMLNEVRALTTFQLIANTFNVRLCSAIKLIEVIGRFTFVKFNVIPDKKSMSQTINNLQMASRWPKYSISNSFIRQSTVEYWTIWLSATSIGMLLEHVPRREMCTA